MQRQEGEGKGSRQLILVSKCNPMSCLSVWCVGGYVIVLFSTSVMISAMWDAVWFFVESSSDPLCPARYSLMTILDSMGFTQ